MGKEIGIDLGTTNTVVSYVNEKGRLRQLKYDGKKVIPSAIFYNSKNEYVIGEKALKKMAINPQAGVKEFKINIDNDEKIEIVAEDGSKFKQSYRKITQEFLNMLISGIESQLIKEFKGDGTIGDVVITVPAKFNEKQKGYIKKAAIDAGFEKVRLLPEPTAAAVAYQSNSYENGETILVYDFGGGTFDVSIIKRENDIYTELATGGKKNLGGRDLDAIIASKIIEDIYDEYDFELPWYEEDFDESDGLNIVDYKMNMMAIKNEAKRIKEELTEVEEYESIITGIVLPEEGMIDYNCIYKRAELNKLIRAKIEDTIEITKRVIDEVKSEYGITKIDEIVLAGGSSQIPLVAELMEEKIAGENYVYADDVSTLISRGAAILANTELKQVTESKTNSQYGVVTTQGVNYKQFEPILLENKLLPYEETKVFYLGQDNQTTLEVGYYEKDVKNYPNAKRSTDDGISMIDTIMISDLPNGLKQREIKIPITFKMDSDGTLVITVKVIDVDDNELDTKTKVTKKSSNLD